MQFLCLCHYDTAKYAACTPDDFAEVARECAPRDLALRESGHLLAVGSLAPPDSYLVIRATDAGPVVEDGP